MERQLIAYPLPKYHKLVVAHCAVHGDKKAWAVNKMVEDYFNKNYSPEEQKKLFALYDKMTDEQRKNPSKYNKSGW